MRKLHICPKVTKTGSIIGHRIDYKGVLRGQRHIPIYPAKINPSTPPPPAPWVTEKRTLREVKRSTLCFISVKIKREGVSQRIKGKHKLRKTLNKNYKYQQACVMTLTVVTRTYTLKSNFLPTNHKYTEKWINNKVVCRLPFWIEWELRNVGFKRDGKNEVLVEIPFWATARTNSTHIWHRPSHSKKEALKRLWKNISILAIKVSKTRLLWTKTIPQIYASTKHFT